MRSVGLSAAFALVWTVIVGINLHTAGKAVAIYCLGSVLGQNPGFTPTLIFCLFLAAEISTAAFYVALTVTHWQKR